MKFRKHILPNALSDWGCFLLLAVFIPLTLIFEFLCVLPEFYAFGALFYWISIGSGGFLAVNVIGNLIACMIIDTSIKNQMLTPPTDNTKRRFWRLCWTCEILAPPRSWHCTTCNTCILKCDHHCIFIGCCIGHRNHRYYIMMLLFLVLGTLFTTVYNSIYFWWIKAHIYAKYLTILNLVFPMVMLFVDPSFLNLYLLIYEMNIGAMLYCIVLFIYHGQTILQGGIAYGRNNKDYDLGWKKNLEMVFGINMRWVWLCPLIPSRLPHDGIHWDTVLRRTQKNR